MLGSYRKQALDWGMLHSIQSYSTQTADKASPALDKAADCAFVPGG